MAVEAGANAWLSEPVGFIRKPYQIGELEELLHQVFG
jgi:hypothetical protein